MKRIISIEDNPASAEYLGIAIEMLGYEHINFRNAKEGLEFMREKGADLILMDVQLPEMDGYEATRILKKDFPDIPIIIQTAYAMSGDKEKAFQVGCDAYLSKPLSLNELKDTIYSFLEKED